MILWAALSLPVALHADTIDYDFSYTPTSGSIQAFSFDIVSSTYLTEGSLNFASFSITDGTNVWDIVQGEETNVALYTGGPATTPCFALATDPSSAVLQTSGACAVNLGMDTAPGAAGILFSYVGAPAFPLSSSGMYEATATIFIGPVGTGDSYVPGSTVGQGAMTLDVTSDPPPDPVSTPEPRLTAALALCFLSMAWFAGRRRRNRLG